MRARLWLAVGALSLLGCSSNEEGSPNAGGSGGVVGSTGGSSGAAGAGNSGGGGAAGSGGVAGGGSSELLTLARFKYQGAFRIPSADYGQSSANYAAGPIAHNPKNHSLFLVGHAQQHPLAEFPIPKLVNSTQLAELEMAAAPSQGFVTFLDDASGGNPQSMDSVSGVLWVDGPNGPELIVNAYEYYDAPGDNTHTTLVIRDASNIAGSIKDGYFALQGAAHAGGWMSPIPSEWQTALGGKFIAGHSSGVPIIGRLSVGPSAFVFDPMAIAGVGSVTSPIATTPLLDFSLDHPLSSDLSNDAGTNKVWTHLSRAVYGFIAPGTRTYVTIGFSGGHSSGVCYKCVPTGGGNCGGYCANDSTDYSHFYWLWDVADLVAVKDGTKQPYEVQPYEYGAFPTPFSSREIGGGAFDPTTGLLYLNVLDADHDQGTYAVPPLVVAYRIE